MTDYDDNTTVINNDDKRRSYKTATTSLVILVPQDTVTSCASALASKSRHNFGNMGHALCYRNVTISVTWVMPYVTEN